MEHNCGFIDGNFKFRYRAAAVIIKDDSVLMVTNDNVDYYYSIGGAVHLGEKAEDAVLREVYEESGLKCRVEKLLFINENFFNENGFESHEINLYYLLTPIDEKIKVFNSSNSCGFVEYLHWIPIKDLQKYKAFPVFFKDELLNLPATPKHFITDDR